MITTKDIYFSNKNRAERFQKATRQEFDLIVIGGGITGAGIALDAALRGISTLLLEKGDFASGTSSKSTKLIHGGLRYLKQFDFGLVRESGLERAVAHHNIPHLVHPERMLLPIVKDGTFNKLTACLAISLYDRLASVEKADRNDPMSKEETEAIEPLLNKELLKSGISYSEYRTDDARLTMEIIKAARREGAEAFNYIEVEDFLYDDETVCGVIGLDKYTNTKISFRSKYVVSAAGPWVDKLRSKDGKLGDKSLHLTKGVHIVVPYDKLPLQSAVYFDAFDGRMLFAIPRGRITYVGTSDTNYDTDLDRVVCTKEDVAYILNATNHMFTQPDLTEDDVISSWAGLRPLIHEEGKSPTELSRRDEIFESERGLLSISGGKLTGYRKMAKRIVDMLQDKDEELSSEKCKTKNYKIQADSFENYKEFKAYEKQLLNEYKVQLVSSFDIWYLTTTYGKNATLILDNALTLENLSLEKAIIKAELDFCIAYENVLYPDDYFNRRSGKLYFDIDSLNRSFDFIIDQFYEYFKWSAIEKDLIISKCRSLIEDCIHFS